MMLQCSHDIAVYVSFAVLMPGVCTPNSREFDFDVDLLPPLVVSTPALALTVHMLLTGHHVLPQLCCHDDPQHWIDNLTVTQTVMTSTSCHVTFPDTIASAAD